jgi:hypothetical protein
VFALCLLLGSLVGCGGQPAGNSARAEVQSLLDRQSAAVLHHDGAAYARTGARTAYENLSAVPFASWSYRLTALHRTGATATADAELSYKVKGYDTSPVTVGRTLTLRLTADAQWYVASDKPAKKSGQQLWDQGRVSVVKGVHSLVMGVGQSVAGLRDYRTLADHAVPAVSAAWGTDWARHVVVLVPGSLDGMAGLLGSPAASYRGIAAVTTGEAGGSGNAPADRIIVNPDAYAMLGAVGKQVVLTHETTHASPHDPRHPPLALGGLRRLDRLPRHRPHPHPGRPGAVPRRRGRQPPDRPPHRQGLRLQQRSDEAGAGVRGRVDGLPNDRGPLGS